MKLNIGCGYNKKEGFLNVDQDPLCKPDLVFDLDQTPWPFQDDQFTEILADHSLEHMGQLTATYINIFKEIYRVAKDQAIMVVRVPHPRHDNFVSDPTHCRAITPIGLALFDQMRNIKDFESGGQESKLGLGLHVDFEVVNVGYDFSHPWNERLKRGEISQKEILEAMDNLYNVCMQIHIILRIHKPGRGEDWIKQVLESR